MPSLKMSMLLALALACCGSQAFQLTKASIRDMHLQHHHASAARLPMLLARGGEDADQETSKRSYLVWEEGFRSKFCATLALLAAGSLLGANAVSSLGTARLQGLGGRLGVWSALGLLSSSCCMLQLILNAFSVGCAGFNTVLGPVRPYFLAMTFFLQGVAWRGVLMGAGSSRAAALATLVVLPLSLLPEGLHAWVQRTTSALGPRTEVSLDVKGMGCTACTLKAKSALEAVPGILDCDVDLERGQARLALSLPHECDPDVKPGEDERRAVREAIEALSAAGFEGSIQGLNLPSS